MKIVIVFKTHFDIGFTDLSKNIIDKYSTTMLGSVLDFCESTSDKPINERYVWTMAAWPLEVSLNNCSEEMKFRAEKLILNKQLVFHALPYTLHTETLSIKDMNHLFDCSKRLCQRYNLEFPKTAKMTDVPGHTIALVKYLAEAGIKFLHLGCNPASIHPDVPTLFWWMDNEGNKVLTFYNSTYGSSLLPPKNWPFPIWLALQQTNDNIGPQSLEEVEKMKENIIRNCPNSDISFGSLDDFYNEISKYDLSKLPVIKGDLGDTWIHGVGSYPKEVSDIRRARNIISNANLSKEDEENFFENSLLFSEHTWGIDVKTFITADRHYEKDAFIKERQSSRYQFAEKSWNEQRQRANICSKIANKYQNKNDDVLDESNQFKIENINGLPSITNKVNGNKISIEYLYGIISKSQIDKFQDLYLTDKVDWALADFGRQNYFKDKEELFKGQLVNCFIKGNEASFEYKSPEDSFNKYGNCPSYVINIKIIKDQIVKVVFNMKDKKASPFVEYGDLLFKTNQKGKKFIVRKIDYDLDVMKDIQKDANNILYCVSDKVLIDNIEINPIDSPLVSFGESAIFKFNGGEAKPRKPIFVFNLFNNMWGTNFPQWIEGDLCFEYLIKM